MACTSPSTQLVIVVDTDYAVPSALASASVTILDAEGLEVSAQDFALTDVADLADPTRFEVPFSFGVVPVGRDASRRIAIEVTGRAPGGALLVSRRAVTGFVSGRSLLLPMFLAQACGGASCPAGQTCTERGCESESIDPGTLLSIRPGDELLRDAGALDAAVDGGVDSGLLDGGPDACVTETCAATGCSCAAGSCCDLSCGDPTGCQVSCEGSCTVNGRNNDALEVSCADVCTVDGSLASAVTITCAAGSSCDIDCMGAGSCNVDCQLGAQCLVRCGGVPSCGLTCAAGGTVACPPMPNTLACDRACP